MTRVWPFSIGFLAPPLVFLAVERGGWWSLLPVLLLYAGLPVGDALLGLSARIHGPDEIARLSEAWSFRLITWLWVPVQAALVLWAVHRFATAPLTPVEQVGLLLSVGTVTGGIGITYAHELVHRSGRFELALGDVLLALVSYPHFAIEHVYGHHRHVGTPADPVTARRGEGLYRFMARAIPGSVAHAWHIEVERARRAGRAVWSPGNRMVRYAITLLALYAAVGLAWGPRAVIALAVQSVVAFSLLETINYIEHYGLVRAETRSPRRADYCAFRNASRASFWSSRRVLNARTTLAASPP